MGDVIDPMVFFRRLDAKKRSAFLEECLDHQRTMRRVYVDGGAAEPMITLYDTILEKGGWLAMSTDTASDGETFKVLLVEPEMGEVPFFAVRVEQCDVMS